MPALPFIASVRVYGEMQTFVTVQKVNLLKKATLRDFSYYMRNQLAHLAI